LSSRAPAARSTWLGNGSEHLRFPNGSRFGIESNTEKAGHGGTLDEAYIDEAFAQVDNRLEQAFGPAMITRTNVQTVVISTAGWLDGSPYLRGRSSTAGGSSSPANRRGSRTSSGPRRRTRTRSTRAVWRACMPALGFTIDEDAIRRRTDSEFESSPEGLNGFRRAYLNQWVPKGPASCAIPAECGRVR
jgi:hypothetical protein